MFVRPVERRDSTDWQRMRQALWPSEQGEHGREIAAFFNGKRDNPAEVLIAFDDVGRSIGFAEVSIRPFAEDCYSGKVAYLEGWYAEPDARRIGVGATLMRAAEEWGRAQGCVEMASDTRSTTLKAPLPIVHRVSTKRGALFATGNPCESVVMGASPWPTMRMFRKSASPFPATSAAV